jgi:very-short-patch-repair endonuclease
MVLRFWGDDIKRKLDDVVSEIVRVLKERDNNGKEI